MNSSSKVTVLHIEDNAANVKLVEHIFKRRPNIRLESAILGASGLDLAQKLLPALILLDLNLPDMNGDEVLTRLKTGASTAAIPVVVLSADATPGQIERVTDLGAYTYLTKPIDVSKLLGLIDGIVPTGMTDETPD